MATSIEYGLIAALVSVAAVTAMSGMKTHDLKPPSADMVPVYSVVGTQAERQRALDILWDNGCTLMPSTNQVICEKGVK